MVNLNELEFEHEPEQGVFQQSYAVVSDRIGAKKLGYNVTVIPPGKRACPFHNHHNNEEMFLVLEGEGQLRFGQDQYPIRAMDIVACPPGGREVAHQFINTGSVDLKFLALSTKDPVEVVEYPDSDKVGVFVGDYGKMSLRKLFLSHSAVDYNHGEVPGPHDSA